MKRLVCIIFSCTLLLFLVASIYAGDIEVKQDGTKKGNPIKLDFVGPTVTFTQDTATVDTTELSADLETTAGSYKYAYMPVCYESPTSFIMGGIGTDLTANAITGALEAGSTEGYIDFDAHTDYVTFYMVLPETYFYDGTAADLQLSFDLSEAAAASGTDSYTLTLYEDGLRTETMLSEDLSMNATARGWVNSTAFGDNLSVSGSNKVLIGKFNTQGTNDDARLYGVRLKYRAGLDFD